MTWNWANSGTTPTSEPLASVVLVQTDSLNARHHVFYIYTWGSDSVMLDIQHIDSDGNILKSQRVTTFAFQKGVMMFKTSAGDRLRIVNVSSLAGTAISVQASINYEN